MEVTETVSQVLWFEKIKRRTPRRTDRRIKIWFQKRNFIIWVLIYSPLYSQGIGATRHQWTRKLQQPRIITFNQSTIETQDTKKSVCMHYVLDRTKTHTSSRVKLLCLKSVSQEGHENLEDFEFMLVIFARWQGKKASSTLSWNENKFKKETHAMTPENLPSLSDFAWAQRIRAECAKADHSPERVAGG
jgi:hypothetical protein